MALKQIINLFLGLLIASIVFVHCAVEAAPLGGVKDTEPPIPSVEESSPNFQTKFTKQDIVLSFNEWVSLKNASEQIVVSPPLSKKLKAKLKKKKVILSFDEEEILKKDVTYTINLGESIVDFTEGNPIENFSFVFSTGEILDSLSLQGIVTDDLTGEPIEDALVLLYDELVDSVFTTKRPLYFSKTNKEGEFKFANLKADTFQVFSLIDKNINYFKDQSTEAIGFLEKNIILTDSFSEVLRIPNFQPLLDLQFFNQEGEEYGMTKLVFNRVIDEVNISTMPENLNYRKQISGDTLLFYYENNNPEAYLYIEGLEKRDTIELFTKPENFNPKNKIKFQSASGNERTGISRFDSLRMSFSSPIFQIDRDKISVLDTTTLDRNNIFISKQANDVIIYYPWVENTKYSIAMLPGSIMGLDSMINDTINYKIKVQSDDSFGEFILNFEKLDSTKQYIAEFGGKNLSKTFFIKNKKEEQITVKSLRPGQYKMRITEDLNQNGRWDPGILIERTKSEKWIEKPLDPLKADWTVEITISGDEFK